MSSRVLRDDLWTSEPIARLHDKTFRLYVCLINAADDYGLVDVGFGEICRAAPMTRWTVEEVSKMLSEMFDSEVLLPYRVEAKSYCAVDKWQCFMRSVKPKHPIPSFGLGHIRMPYGFKNVRVRESAALLLKHLDIKGATPGIPQGVPGSDLGHEGKLGVGSREEGKKGKRIKPSPTPPTRPCPPGVTAEAWSAWLEVRTRLKSPLTDFAYSRAVSQLAQWASAGHNPDSVVAASAANGWKGLFEPKEKPSEPRPKEGEKRMTQWGEETYFEGSGWMT